MEFKLKAVELSNVRGNVQEIARELGISAEFHLPLAQGTEFKSIPCLQRQWQQTVLLSK
ncbi:MAG: hypothetical protein IT223_07845 [Crocinitomicaceae bacterium]|nr:hypothetical protein [Crocinitomicaceae bacterium]